MLFIHFLVLLTSIFFILCFKRDFFRLSVSSFYFVSLIAFSYIGIPFLYDKIIHHAVLMGVVNTEILELMYIYSWFSVLFFALGYILSLTRLSIFEFNSGMSRGGLYLTPKITLYCAYILMFLCFCVTLLYLSKVPSIALFAGHGAEAMSARSDMTNAFSGKYHWYKAFFRDLALFTFLFILTISCLEKKKVSKFTILILFAFVSFTHLMTGEKSTFVWFLISIFLVNLQVYHQGKVKVKYLIMLFVIVFGLLYISYIFFMDVDGDIIEILIGRAFVGQVMPAYYYLDYFKEGNYLLGSTFPSYGGILPFERVMITSFLADKVFPNSPIAMTLPSVYWAEMHANFGPIGVIGSSIFIGFILGSIDKSLAKVRLSSLRISLVAWCSIHFMTLSGGALSDFFYDIFLMLILFASFLLNLSLKFVWKRNER
ncbi:O-antigen polymerase [Shewanella algae]|uniref:O-antigen polymerase n=1 Tax=Shewanella algae TaxID=38313 RepID=UPI00313D0CCB